MKIITFNVRCANDENDNFIDQRAPRLKAVLDKYDGDVIGFQEVTPYWFDIIQRDYSDEYCIFNKFRSKEKSVEGCTIMWRKDSFTCVDSGYFWFSKTPWVESMGDDARYHCNRICQWALLRAR